MSRFERSEELHRRACRSIPLGSQTFSKSTAQLPLGVSPLFAERGEGSHLWDVDGHEYVDFVMGLASVSLGYGDPDVERAVIDQLRRGVTLSLAHPLEIEVAERIVSLVPCAEQVRFGKNGSDATAGAIRLARACTGRDRVAVCGYHGWQDWYIGSTSRHLGVPAATRELTHTFAYNDAAMLERLLDQHRGEFAAVILEPMNAHFPANGFLEAVRDLATSHGAVLVFDETITGFRFGLGGAQELFGVTPDLATFGKGLANGFPLSALVGRAELMERMAEVFFSTTFGGETLSLAAARAVLNKLVSAAVPQQLAVRGQEIIAGVEELRARHDVGDLLGVGGHPSWSFVLLRDAAPYTAAELKTLFLQEVFARGIFTLGTHNMCASHSAADVAALLAAYDEVFPILREAVHERDLPDRLRCPPLRPIFEVRGR